MGGAAYKQLLLSFPLLINAACLLETNEVKQIFGKYIWKNNYLKLKFSTCIRNYRKFF